jgi:SAM-dependent methyltransferase
MLFTKDGYQIVRCDRCMLLYVDAELGSSELAARYDADYYGGGMFADYIGERQERIASARTYCRILERVQPEGRLLDVGCAAGFFLEAASKHWDVMGVELSGFASDYARREFGHTVLTGDLAEVDLPDAAFNVVTLWNTVEHMSNPRQAMAHVARVAAPGALIVLTTGNATGPLARRDLFNWNLMTPPEHLYFFDPRTITRLLEGQGLGVRRVALDGFVSTTGALTLPPVRVIASALGFGNVMTVFARRMPGLWPRRARARRCAARVRPVSRV